MTYVIALPCVDLLDKACIEECPVDCIYEGERMLYIHPDECVDCGACEPVCPVEAIFYEDDVPERLVRAIALVGAAAEARGRLEDYRRAGADLPVVYPVVVPGGPAAASAAHTIRALAPSGEVANPR